MGITFTFWKIWLFILLNYDHTRAETLTMCQSASNSEARHIARVKTSDKTTAFYELYDNGAFDTDGGCTSFDVFDTTGSFISIDIQQCQPDAGDGLTFRNITYGSVIIPFNSLSGDCFFKKNNGVRIDATLPTTPGNLCESVNIDNTGTATSNVNSDGSFVDDVFFTACEDAILSSAPTLQTNAPTLQTNAPTLQTNAPTDSTLSQPIPSDFNVNNNIIPEQKEIELINNSPIVIEHNKRKKHKKKRRKKSINIDLQEDIIPQVEYQPTLQTSATSKAPAQDKAKVDQVNQVQSSGSGSEEYEFFGAKSEMNLDENDDGVVHMVLKFSDNVWVNLWCLFAAVIFICILAYLSFCYKKNQ